MPFLLPFRALTTASLIVAASVTAMTGCGSTTASKPQQQATVLLDWTANPAHTGILVALGRKLDRQNHVAITLRTPSSSTDAVRLLLAGRADLAVMDIHDLAIARERGRDLVAVMAVVGHPLASVIAAPDVHRPKDLEGISVAVTGVPSDAAVIRAIVHGDGGSPSKVILKNTGFGAVPALLGGRTKAAIGFLNEEGVSVTSKHSDYRVFRLEDFGSPAYPELVLVATRQTLDTEPTLVRSVVRAFVSGTQYAEENPSEATKLVSARLPGADATLLPLRMKAALGALLPPDGKAGSLDSELLSAWATWEQKSGLVSTRPNVSKAFDGQFLN